MKLPDDWAEQICAEMNDTMIFVQIVLMILCVLFALAIMGAIGIGWFYL